MVLSEPASSSLEHLPFLGPHPYLALPSSLYYADKERERLYPLQLPPSPLSLGLSGASSGGRLSSIQPLLALIGVLGLSFVWVFFFLRAPWRSRSETGGASFLFFWNPVVKCAQPLCEMCTSGDNVRLHYWAREYPPILPPRLLSICGPRGVPGPDPQGAPRSPSRLLPGAGEAALHTPAWCYAVYVAMSLPPLPRASHQLTRSPRLWAPLAARAQRPPRSADP